MTGFSSEEDFVNADESLPSETEQIENDSQDQELVTPDETDANESETGAAKDDVPFNQHPRWKEILSERDALRAETASLKAQADRAARFAPVLDEFEQSGLKDVQDLRRAQEAQMLKQSEQVKAQQEKAASDRYFHATEVEFKDSAEALKDYNLEMREIALSYRDWENTQRENRLTNLERGLAAQDTQKQIATLLKSYPEADADLLSTLASTKGVDLEQVAKQTHTKAAMIVAQYNSKKTATRGRITPEGAGGSPVPRQPAMPNPDTHPKEYDAWYAQQLKNTEKTYGGYR